MSRIVGHVVVVVTTAGWASAYFEYYGGGGKTQCQNREQDCKY